MKCDTCGKPATVEEAVRVGKTFVFKHLCESCAAASGILASQTPLPVGITQKTVVKAAVRVAGPEPACPSCGMTLRAFRSAKRLGCGECYSVFESMLAPVIAREHEGATHHCGKVPTRLGEGDSSAGSVDTDASIERSLQQARTRAARIRELRALLTVTLAAEHYERAAEIKRLIDRLERGGDESASSDDDQPTGGGPASGPGSGPENRDDR
ncbi:MAG: hypothetical protein AAGF47_06140 [Planctomycetota bacterium]